VYDWQPEQVKEFIEVVLAERAVALARAIADGDERLREHVSNQIERLQADLISADKLERERIARVDESVSSLRSEIQAAAAASKEAILKQERANELRFEGANEWRSQSADRERTQAEAILRLTSTFLRSETYDVSQRDFGEWRKRVDDFMVANLARRSGLSEKEEEHRLSASLTLAIIGSAVGVLGLVLTIAVLLVHHA
jgi:hypothetical protein